MPAYRLPSRMDIRSYRNQRPRLGARVYVDRAAVVVGDVEVGDDASLWPFTVARGDVNFIRIGARTNVQDGTVLHVTHDGPYTLIGMRAAVLDGARVCRHSMVGAGAVVTPGKVVREGELWLGNPARCVRLLS